MKSDDLSVLENAINKALNELYKNDLYLICNRSNSANRVGHSSERSIVFRFGIYFQKYLYETKFAEYNLDNEYNRNLDELKVLPDFQNGTYPDLILHKRGSNNCNILILEFKTWWNKNTDCDKRKIKQFVDIVGEYRYHYGASIVLGREKPEVKWIER